jgi:hypothetical protein
MGGGCRDRRRGRFTSCPRKSGLKCSIHRERDLYADAAKRLKRSEPAIRKTLAELGRGVDGGWRAEQKSAALGAWLILTS